MELPDPAALEHAPLLDEAGETTPGMQANAVSHRASPGGTSGRSKREGHFSLTEHFPPVPPKLVQKIQAGEFVDLAELLPDNMEMVRRASIEGQGQSQRQLRRVVNPPHLGAVFFNVRCNPGRGSTAPIVGSFGLHATHCEGGAA